jgi:hypothetical protein
MNWPRALDCAGEPEVRPGAKGETARGAGGGIRDRTANVVDGIDRQPGIGLVHRIGSRRAAAIALRLGELLALRVPERAPANANALRASISAAAAITCR